MAFYLVLMLCQPGFAVCVASTQPASFPTYELCQQAYGATSKYDARNTLQTKGFACTVGPVKAGS